MNCCMDCGSKDIYAAYLRTPKDSNCTLDVCEEAYWADTSYITLRCRDCGSVFLHPHYHEESFSVYSSSRYFTGYYPNNIHSGGGPDITASSTGGIREAVRARRSRRRAESILKFAGLQPGETPKVLEVGCASGRLVKAFSDLGCDAYGVDVSQEAVQAALGQGVNAFCGRLEDFDGDEGSFDVIIAVQTLEHMASLDGFLSGVRRLLKPHGAFVFEVPNDIDGYRGKLYRGHWWMIPPMHIRYFTPESAANILSRHCLQMAALATGGSFGADLYMVVDWTARKARMNALPGFGVARLVGSALFANAFRPVDWFLNARKMHSELLVLARNG